MLGIAVVTGVAVLLNRDSPSAPTPSKDVAEATYTIEDVKKHDTKTSCWTIISGSVYDITSYIPRHPGGDEILRACGQDATTLFKTRQTGDGQPVGSGSPHSANAEEQLKKLFIGKLH